MKQIVTTTVLIILYCTQAFAQRFSVGVRAGINYWSESYIATSVFDESTALSTLNREIFMAYQLKKQILIEAGVSNYYFRHSYFVDAHCGFLPVPAVNYDVNYSGNDYHMSIMHGLHPLGKQKFQHFVGITASYIMTNAVYNTTVWDLQTSNLVDAKHTYEIPLRDYYLIGVNYFARYNFNKHLFICTNFNFKPSPTSLIYNLFAIPDYKLELSAGIGYTF